mmetsp:Transcript_49324/g.142945  ORF Transcript_49324/g.142945 Transcript_49324/m.142945 type:complete len:502 (+) Transcript_49324:128-1633(+)
MWMPTCFVLLRSLCSPQCSSRAGSRRVQDFAQVGDMELQVGVSDACPKMVTVGFGDIARNFVLMGWTAFGGPAAHVGLFQKTFVEQKKWMSIDVFTELFAVCQCMPGPSSTQMSFALGTTKKGVLGGLLSGILFQYPGAFAMTALGLTASEWASAQVMRDNTWLAGLVGGLSAAGVALVASAAIGLWNKACAAPDARVLAGFCCVVLLYFSAEMITPPDRDGRKAMWIFPLLIIFGGVVTYVYRGPLEGGGSANAAEAAQDSSIEHFGVGKGVGIVLIMVVALVFVGSFIASNTLEYQDSMHLHWFSAFWRTGTVIWGGGQVVLPLLENEVVSTGWVEESVFFAGLALAQAMPGPLFNFAAFLGAAAGKQWVGTVAGGIGAAGVCWLGLFGPGVILIFGILPFWGKFRSNATYKRALPGLNAAAVGLLIASLVQMAAGVRENNTKPQGPIPREASTCIGLVAFWAVHWLKIPNATLTQIQAPIVIVVAGLVGIIAGLLDMK